MAAAWSSSRVWLLLFAVASCACGPSLATPLAVSKANEVLGSGNNQGLPFLVIDKAKARVLAFDSDGKLLGESPALLGLATGDIAPADIGIRPAARIGPADRITPAGRFVASLGHDFVQDLLWIDYASGLSLHRVVKGGANDRRAARLASETHLDNRISFGCINVPGDFYDDIVRPLFSGTVGIVYILSENSQVSNLSSAPNEKTN